MQHTRTRRLQFLCASTCVLAVILLTGIAQHATDWLPSAEDAMTTLEYLLFS